MCGSGALSRPFTTAPLHAIPPLPIHLRRSFTSVPRYANPSTTSHSDTPVCVYLWPGSPNGAIDIRTVWLSNLPLRTAPILTGFSH
ncbi:hypothetical protein AVEN_269438-1 [Araneus ventricosus]|uniref:Uncharacterized protein n=1 Tax=Araneus ventricosus TaxID=182803 RepID=A0A4Y2JFE2_ARAVE|nr:hypothetical protein AVEN_269438-1 [Araneus ventricosus]